MLWLSAQQIADAAAAGLMPGLPTNERSVRRVATRECWAETGLSKIRAGQEGGGGLEYHVDLLPVFARLTWLSSKLTVCERDLRPCLSDGPVNTAHDARQVLLRLAGRFQTENKMAQTASDSLFCDLFNGGSLDLPDWIAGEISSLSARTLARWR